MTSSPHPARNIDVPTLIAIALAAYAITNVVHEGLGHGGMCLLVGGRPLELSAVYFDYDHTTVSESGAKWISAGGTLANLVLAALAWVGLRATGRANTPGRYFLWLLMTVSLLQATGYWLFSGLAGVGDWVKVIAHQEPLVLWRLLLATAGGVGYYLSLRLSLSALNAFLPIGEGRLVLARRLMFVPYVAGAALYILAGLLNPVSPILILISAAAASLGGTSGLAWSHNLLRNQARFAPIQGTPLTIPRSVPWLATGTVVAMVFIVVLGRTLQL